MPVYYQGRDVSKRVNQLREKAMVATARGEQMQLYPTEVLFILDLAEGQARGEDRCLSAGESAS